MVALRAVDVGEENAKGLQVVVDLRAVDRLIAFQREVEAAVVEEFDRSWYGRVLVERVEGFASLEEWERAYGEIVELERLLAAEGTILIKLWLHISEHEQLRRFERGSESR